MIGTLHVSDYEHEGDVRNEFRDFKKTDPSAKLLDFEILKDDEDLPYAASIKVKFNKDLLKDLQNNFELFVDNMETVYISKSGKSYSYKKTVLYNKEIALDKAIEQGYVQNKSKWAQKIN